MSSKKKYKPSDEIYYVEGTVLYRQWTDGDFAHQTQLTSVKPRFEDDIFWEFQYLTNNCVDLQFDEICYEAGGEVLGTVRTPRSHVGHEAAWGLHKKCNIFTSTLSSVRVAGTVL